MRKEHQAGITVVALCRKYGIRDATFYTWRKRHVGMDVFDARQIKGLDEETRNLKKLLAESIATLREALGKNFRRSV